MVWPSDRQSVVNAHKQKWAFLFSFLLFFFQLNSLWCHFLLTFLPVTYVATNTLFRKVFFFLLSTHATPNKPTGCSVCFGNILWKNHYCHNYRKSRISLLCNEPRVLFLWLCPLCVYGSSICLYGSFICGSAINLPAWITQSCHQRWLH